MSFEVHPATAWTAAAIVVATATVFAGGHWWGAGSVLDSVRLQAENEILYQLVTVQSSAPNDELLAAAIRICDEEPDASQDDCMKDFLDRYGDVWVVNLVEGTRVLLTPGNAQDIGR